MQLTLAPHLRQSLEFLQVPMFELRALIRREMEQNPTIEERPEPHDPVEPEAGGGEAGAGEPEGELDFQEDYAALLRLDEEWREYFQQAAAARPHTSDDEARRRHLIESVTRPETLQEHLLAQLGFLDLGEEDRALVTLLVGSLNDDGYLNVTLGELSETTGCPIGRLEAALRALQDLDPIGVGARDLRECLRLQLDRLGAGAGVAARIVGDHLDALAAQRHVEIARALECPVDEVFRAARLLSTLEPRPGRAFGGEDAAPIVPEVIVLQVGGEYIAQTVDDRLPRVRISRFYRQMLEDPATPRETREYIRDKIRAGAFLIRSIGQRQRTILRIATEIVSAQRDFLDRGPAHLRPLAMSDVAARVGVHETTVSRAIAQKYMQTPRGLFEMKYFFAPGYRAADGHAVSNKAIMDRIEQLIGEEDPARPLSDQAIAARIREQGFSVARRTIAKYREALQLPASHERRLRA